MSSLLVTTFPKRSEYDQAKAQLDKLCLSHRVIEPSRAYRCVGVPALVLDWDARGGLAKSEAGDPYCSGWVDYRPAEIAMPEEDPPNFTENVFGTAAVMVLAPCVADATRVRIVAHISGDLTGVFPYLNAEMHGARYNVKGPMLTFMEQYRIVTLYPRRVTIAKADEIVDVWRLLESIRCRANEVWARRAEIAPSYELREKPPAIEIYKRLPRTNCKACGELTCLAFAVKLWGDEAALAQCRPAMEGEYRHLQEALVEICAGLGLSDTDL